MKIHFLMPALCLLFLIFSCKDSETTGEENNNSISDVEYSPTANEISRKDTEEKIDDSVQSKGEDQKEAPASEGVVAIQPVKYIKNDQPGDQSCGCYCINVNFDSISQLCLIEDAMYISARMEQDGQNVNIFLVEPSSRNSEGEDFPWQDFDTNTPIATITPRNNGEIELDWLGFTINGDLAIDYAIYGKKTLEGVYKQM